jgi:hypothetical protein
MLAQERLVLAHASPKYLVLDRFHFLACHFLHRVYALATHVEKEGECAA